MHSTSQLKTEETEFLPVHLRRHACMVRVEDIPQEMNVVWLVAVIMLNAKKE